MQLWNSLFEMSLFVTVGGCSTFPLFALRSSERLYQYFNLFQFISDTKNLRDLFPCILTPALTHTYGESVSIWIVCKHQQSLTIKQTTNYLTDTSIHVIKTIHELSPMEYTTVTCIHPHTRTHTSLGLYMSRFVFHHFNRMRARLVTTIDVCGEQ